MAKSIIKLRGLEKTLKELNKRVSNVESAAPKAFTDVVLDLTGKSIDRAPVKDGMLRGSGFAEINGVRVAQGMKGGGMKTLGTAPKVSKLRGKVGFSEEYALIQHERLDFSHPQGGEAKYLENPLKENRDKYINHIKNSIKKAVE